MLKNKKILSTVIISVLIFGFLFSVVDAKKPIRPEPPIEDERELPNPIEPKPTPDPSICYDVVLEPWFNPDTLRWEWIIISYTPYYCDIPTIDLSTF